MGCSAESAMMFERPVGDSVAVSQLLHGETFQLLDVTGDWAWGYSDHDGYVGYVARAALGPAVRPTHIVTAIEAPVFARPDIKAPAIRRLPIGARIGGSQEGGFLKIAEGYVHRRHVAPIGLATNDWTAVAATYLGQPYLWGGRGAGGIDCSGLVQLALERCGISAPRDTDLQREAIGEPLAHDVPSRRGDLIFFPGHVGIMTNGAELLHATAFWMATVVEPLADVVAQLSSHHEQPILARRRVGHRA